MSLKCFYTNAGSLIQKLTELKERICMQQFDIVAVTETWAHADIGDAELAIEGYVTYRIDRTHQRGGGVILYVKDTLKSVQENGVNIESFEDCVWCTIWTSEGKLLVGVCYRSPNSSRENNEKLRRIMERAVGKSSH